MEDDIVPTCKELGIKLVASSPLGGGFLTGALEDRGDLGGDYTASSTKFSEENFANNLELVKAVEPIAARLGITVGQLSLAWLQYHGDDVIPIPGKGEASVLLLDCMILETLSV